jgi:hypothetical protein
LIFEGHVTAAYSWVLLILGADPGFVELEAYTDFGVLFNKKSTKITNTKLCTKLNNRLGTL